MSARNSHPHHVNVERSISSDDLKPSSMLKNAAYEAGPCARVSHANGRISPRKSELLRMGNIGIRAESLDDAIPFFTKLGLKLEGRAEPLVGGR